MRNDQLQEGLNADSCNSKSIDDTGLRVSDNSILAECENNSKYQYKYVVYDDMEDGPVIRDVYAIGRIDPNVEDDVASQCHNIARYIKDVKELHYDNQQVYEPILRSRVEGTAYLLARYNNRSKRFYVIGRGSAKNGRNTLNKSVRERTAGQDTRVAEELTDSRHSLEVDREFQRASEEQKAETAYHYNRYGNDLLFLYFASKSTAISAVTPKAFCFLLLFV